MPSNKKIDLNQIKKILIIQFRPFGDVFLCSAIFEAIKKKIPHAEIYYLTKHPFQITVADHPYLDHVITTSNSKGLKYIIDRFKLFRQIYNEKFDLVIDQQNNPGSQQVTFFSRAKFRIGYKHGQYSFAYNVKMRRGEKRYSPSMRFDLLKDLGITESKWKFYYRINDSSREKISLFLNQLNLLDKPFVVFSPGSPNRKQSKQWNLDNYAKLNDLIQEKYQLPVVLLWAKSEINDCQYIHKIAKHKPILAIDTNLNEAIALLEKTSLLICNDGGINHFSCVSNTQTIAIFGVTNPLKWSPASVFSHHHHLYKEGFPSEKDNSFGISPDDVIEKINELIHNKSINFGK